MTWVPFHVHVVVPLDDIGGHPRLPIGKTPPRRLSNSAGRSASSGLKGWPRAARQPPAPAMSPSRRRPGGGPTVGAPDPEDGGYVEAGGAGGVPEGEDARGVTLEGADFLEPPAGHQRPLGGRSRRVPGIPWRELSWTMSAALQDP